MPEAAQTDRDTHVIDQLKATVGEANVLTQPDAVAVARPSETTEVDQLVTLCVETDIAAVTYSGMTDLCGGEDQTKGQRSLVISQSRMNAGRSNQFNTAERTYRDLSDIICSNSAYGAEHYQMTDLEMDPNKAPRMRM